MMYLQVFVEKRMNGSTRQFEYRFGLRKAILKSPPENDPTSKTVEKTRAAARMQLMCNTSTVKCYA